MSEPGSERPHRNQKALTRGLDNISAKDNPSSTGLVARCFQGRLDYYNGVSLCAAVDNDILAAFGGRRKSLSAHSGSRSAS